MHAYDIEDAVARSDSHGLQRAFRLLVDFPRLGHVAGARSAAKLDDLLDQVAASLQLDQTAMPDHLRQAVERMANLSLQAGASYAQGAIIVFEFRDRWRALFADPMTAAA